MMKIRLQILYKYLFDLAPTVFFPALFGKLYNKTQNFIVRELGLGLSLIMYYLPCFRNACNLLTIEY